MNASVSKKILGCTSNPRSGEDNLLTPAQPAAMQHCANTWDVLDTHALRLQWTWAAYQYQLGTEV